MTLTHRVHISETPRRRYVLGLGMDSSHILDIIEIYFMKLILNLKCLPIFIKYNNRAYLETMHLTINMNELSSHLLHKLLILISPSL